MKKIIKKLQTALHFIYTIATLFITPLLIMSFSQLPGIELHNGDREIAQYVMWLYIMVHGNFAISAWFKED